MEKEETTLKWEGGQVGESPLWNRIRIQGLDDVDVQGFDWPGSQYQGLATLIGHARCRNIIFIYVEQYCYSRFSA